MKKIKNYVIKETQKATRHSPETHLFYNGFDGDLAFEFGESKRCAKKFKSKFQAKRELRKLKKEVPSVYKELYSSGVCSLSVEPIFVTKNKRFRRK